MGTESESCYDDQRQDGTPSEAERRASNAKSDKLPCQVNMTSSTSADEANSVCEPDPNILASIRLQQLKFEFLVAVEKIRKETEVAKAKNQPKTQEQQKQQALKLCPKLDSQHCVTPQLLSYTEEPPVVPSSSINIPTTAYRNASLMSTGTESSKPCESEHTGLAPIPRVSSVKVPPGLSLDWRTGWSSFHGRMPAMENQGLPLSMDSKYCFGVADDVFSTICDLESRPNSFSRKGRGNRVDSNSTSCKVPKLSSTASVHSDTGEFSGQVNTPSEGGTSPNESDDATTKTQSQDIKCKRYKRTQEALQSSGLLDVTMKTAELIKRNRQLQKDIQDFKKETVEFLKSVLKNPENKEYTKFFHGKIST